MSGRCLACNCILSDEEMTTQIPNTTEYQDLCFVCIAKSNADIDENEWLLFSTQVEEFPETLE